MPLLIMCSNPECGELFEAPDAAAGKEVRCPACGAVKVLGGETRQTSPSVKPSVPEGPAVSPPKAPNSAEDVEPTEQKLAPLPFADGEQEDHPPTF
ncbi:MAG: hypothetical protein ACYSTL_01885, partial [Planctomycetota bacterium]